MWLLTPLQWRVLKAFFAVPFFRGFVLTGGTALAVFYLFHRVSEDLDLFTPNPEDMQEVERGIHELSLREGWAVKPERRSPFFCRVFFTEAGSEWPLMETQGIRVDSLENIGANKVTALMSRGEARDFIDLYFILKETPLTFDQLLEMAKQKDPGLKEFYLAGFIHQQIRRWRSLPSLPLRKPLDLADFQRFYEELAEALMRRSKPNLFGDRPNL